MVVVADGLGVIEEIRAVADPIPVDEPAGHRDRDMLGPVAATFS
jgi:hypothetical protein